MSLPGEDRSEHTGLQLGPAAADPAGVGLARVGHRGLHAGGGGVTAGLADRLLELHKLLHVPDLGVPLPVHLQVQEGHQGLRHDALYDGGEEDGDDDGVLEELPVGAPVAGHHGEGDGSPQTPQHYDGLPPPVDLLLAQSVQDQAEATSHQQSADSDDDDDSDAELPDVEEVAGVELGAEEEEEESLEDGGDGLGDAGGEAGGLGAVGEE